MSASENKDEIKSDGAEDVDIYSDVLSDQDSLISKLQEKINKLSKEKELLLKSLSSLQKSYDELHSEYTDLKEKYKVISFNSSALFKTAQTEIKRKDRLINEIRKEKDDLVFRKSSVNQALQRSRRCAKLSPRKCKSPIKKQRIDVSNVLSKSSRQTKEQPVQKNTGLPKELAETNIKEELGDSNLAERATEKLECSTPSVESTKVKMNPIATNILSEQNGSDAQVNSVQEGNENENTVKLRSGKNLSTPKVIENNKAQAIPPPLKGPLTAYSKRMYKRIHGVSPDKADKIPLKKIELPVTTGLVQNNTVKEIETTPVCMLDSITTKLQKDVQEIIKLGTSSKTSPPSTSKLSPEKQTQKVTPTDNLTPSKSPNEKLVIKCDLRESSKKNERNSYSLNESINNILKKEKAGHYSPHANLVSDKKEVEVKKNCLDNDSMCRAPSRLLTNINKKTIEKLTISPVTFGKLVPHSEKPKLSDNSPSTKEDTKTPPEINSESRKRKLSETSEDKNSHQLGQRPRLETYTKTDKKNKFITSLFGESPLKSALDNIKSERMTPSEMPNELILPSPSERLTQPGSPIFPDSPSLDSDYNEDLVIDTTCGSQNTSPRVSESDQMYLDKTDESSPVKTVVCCNIPESNLDGKDSRLEVVTAAVAITDTSVSDQRNPFEKSENDLPMVNCVHHRKEEEPVISFSQTVVESKKTISDEVIPECLLVTNEDKKESLPNNKMNNSGDDTSKILHIENSQSSVSLEKVSSPKKGCESQSLPHNDSKSATLKKSSQEEKTVDRFIPSPPELSLVSAFKHSDNSVFALTEDTLGFVSALTRMRDISPIRTPDKKSKLFNGSLLQSQQTESNEPKKVIDKEFVATKNNNFEFLKPLSQSLQVCSESSQTSLIDVLSSKPAKTFNLSSEKSASSSSLKLSENPEKEENEKSDISVDKSIIPVSERFPVSKDLSNSKVTEWTEHNPFKRNRPVRRLAIKTKGNSELKTTCNTETVQSPLIQKKHTDSSQGQVNDKNAKLVEQSNLTCKFSKNTVNCTVRSGKSVNDKVVEQQNNNLVDKAEASRQNEKPTNSSVNVVRVKNVGSGDVNVCLFKNQELPPLNSTNSDTVKSFKRSESLKMIQKPLPRNYLNVIKKADIAKLEEVLQVSKSKTKTSEELVPNKGDQYNKSDKAHSEFDQISHIASINKKLRISKYQSKPDKENLSKAYQLEPSIVNEKSACKLKGKEDSIQEHKKISSSVNRDVLPEKEGEPTVEKLHSISVNVPQKGKRQNVRRSVSLGPEIRFRGNVNVPSNRKNKRDINPSNLVSKDSNIKHAGEMRENKVQVKITPTKVSEKQPLKSDYSKQEKMSKDEMIKNKCNSPSSNNLKSRSPSPRNNQSTPKSHTKSKSPEVERRMPKKSRSPLSQSPNSVKRSRSSYKKSPRKSPESERRSNHNSRRLCSRSPEYNKRKDSHKYSPRRTNSGGRSRRSRYDDYHRRSPSPDTRRHRYSEKEYQSRSRSSHHKSRHRSDRSRSRSSELKHRKIEERQRHKSRNDCRRSRSGSCHSRGRGPRNVSPFRRKSSSNIVNNDVSSTIHSSSTSNTNLSKSAGNKFDKMVEENKDEDNVLNYKEELAKMRKEIEALKGKVKESEDVPKDSTPVQNTKENSFQEKIRNVRSFELSVNKLVEPVKNSNTPVSNKVECISTIITEECSSTTETEESVLCQANSAKALQNHISVQNQETFKTVISSLKHPSFANITSPLLQKSPIIIPVKRNRAPKLGDSDVKVVSIK